jgi:hypothetical protein
MPLAGLGMVKGAKIVQGPIKPERVAILETVDKSFCQLKFSFHKGRGG